MTVLITGGAGYIGSHAALAFLDAGETPVVVDNLSTGFDWLLPEGVPLYQQDIADREEMETVLRRHDIETIVHFAGSIILPESIENPLKYYRNNTVNSLGLMEAAVACGVRHFVFSSTAAVYGLPDSVPVPESAPLRPQAPYGASKLMTEQMLMDVAKAHDLTVTALRYFNVAGADPRGRSGQATREATNLIKVACEAATGKRPSMTVFGQDYDTPDGTAIRDYIHVTDLALAHRLAVERMRSGGGNLIANCGYGRGFSVLEVVRAVKAASRSDFTVEMGARRPGDCPEVVADSRLARAELNWQPELDDINQIVADAYRWEEALAKRNRV
ncbi:UDP-glucose 4-epimerase GalE [Roseibium sediminicola]|uniref:UDP-glucose 4-epimerase n=1 Tax=Roseibium sediminicola TaxID=2933272 RepID=A0ABT0H305_9HYPH|nr:UDP-glucose 4-epimerase GalE [Roseibium sp. CAU 1639]MCK7616001.1 UDP-glucose 4-epimerase GalE [Roseibium sp. CAU 1639]